MSMRTRGVAIFAAISGALVALTMWSVHVRTDEEPARAERTVPITSDAFRDQPTGAILIDLDDDADDADRGRVSRLLSRAIAPFAWTRGLSEPLSDAAQLYRVTPPASELQDVIRDLRDDEDVESVEVERFWTLPESAEAFRDLDGAHDPEAGDPDTSRPGRFTPNDPYYKHQWHLDQIQMPEAWTMSRGADVVVAVIDTGVLFRSHERFRQAPDLAGTRFVSGRDFVDNDRYADDEHGHGTHVAGTIAQTTDNQLGVAGVAPSAAIMPIRVLDARGAGRWGAIAAGIRWAADHGADVINMSLGGGTSSRSIQQAINHAHRKGVVIVAAAGNTGRGRVEFPAAHRHTIAVGAVRFDETLSFYSSWGTALDVVAPGGDLRVDQNKDGLPDGVLQNTMIRGNPGAHDYLAFQGTSMAAPHVAGVAALLRANGVKDPDTLETILKETAKSKEDRRRYGSGLIQAADALKASKRGFGAARGTAALGFLFLSMLGLSRRRRLSASVEGKNVRIGLFAFAIAGGLSLLPFVSGLSLLSALSANSMGAILACSALVPFAALALGYGSKRAHPYLVGLSVGVAGFLAVEAVVPTLTFSLPPIVIGPWLIANALACLFFARMVAMSDAKR